MAKENTSGLGVSSRYGPVSVPDCAIGVTKTAGGGNELIAEFSAATIQSGQAAGVVVLPPMCRPTSAYVEVETAITLSGVGALLCLGTEGSLTADSAQITGSAIGVGFYTATLKGTWSTGLSATTTIALAALPATALSGGAGRFVVKYDKV